MTTVHYVDKLQSVYIVLNNNAISKTNIFHSHTAILSASIWFSCTTDMIIPFLFLHFQTIDEWLKKLFAKKIDEMRIISL